MNEIFKIVLSLSLSGSILILVLLFCKPLFKNRISKGWQYYVWLVVIARLVLPFTPETSLAGNLFQDAGRSMVHLDTIPAPEQGDITGTPLLGSDTVDGGFAPQDRGLLKVTTPISQTILSYGLQNLWLLWLVVSLILLIRKITIYQSFVRYIKAGRAEVSDTDLLDRLALIGEHAGVKRAVELYTNSLISSPLLLGFFRPCIVLPTTDLPDPDFEYIILHELAHYKRRDMFYKWLVQLTLCLHWFNPLAYLIGREVSRTCELACDEAVICKLDAKKQRAYGDMLLNAIVAGGDYRDFLASMTLNKSKELLKERLVAIMKFKNPSKIMRLSTAFLTVAIIFGATFTGAYAAIPNRAASTKKANETGTVVFNLNSNKQNSIHHSSSFEAQANQRLVLDIQSSITGGTVDLFLFSPNGKEQHITIGGSNKTETISLTAGRWAYNCTGVFMSGTVTIKGQLSTVEESQEMYDINIDKIGINKVACIGQINLNKDIAYRLNITARSGGGLFVGLHSSNQITLLKGVTFDQRFGTTNRTINTKFKSGESESYYVYVGNEGNTTLKEVRGSLYLDKKYPANQPPPSTTTQTNIINISSNGQQNIIKSGSFKAKDKQLLTLTIRSDIKGGTVDFFLFSPTGQEQRITIGGSNKTETVTLTGGRWAYNCTGFFKSGAVTIKGQLSALDSSAP